MLIGAKTDIAETPFFGKPQPTAKAYETLLEVTGSIVSRMDLSDLFRELLESLKQFGKFDFLNLVLHDPVKNVMRLNVLQSLMPVSIPMSLEVPVGDSPAGWVWQKQEALLLRDLAAEERFGSYIPMLRESGIQTYYVFPLKASKGCHGAVSFGSRQLSAYDDPDLKLLERLAMQIAAGVDTSPAHVIVRTYEEQLAREHAQLRLLHDISNALTQHLDTNQLFLEISKFIGSIMPHDYCSLLLHELATDQLRMRAIHFPNGIDFAGDESVFSAHGCPAARALASHNPVLVNRLSMDNFPSNRTQFLLDKGIKSGCWLPLAGRERFLGTFGICSFRESAFRPGDLNLLSQIANQVAIALDNALAFEKIAELKNKLAEEKIYLEQEIQAEHNFEEIIGKSPVLKQVLQEVETVAQTDSTVIILGETGTGKELIARAIHNLSNRRDHTLVKVNCAAIPTGLLESELFGHERGAFTGAIAQKIGRVELADKGTLFLDEVGDIPLELQPKLLRVLQEQEFERLGSTRTIRVAARLIVATHRDLEAMVGQRTFREDLYYRLNIFPIRVPSLRERTSDIPLLVNFFVDKYSKRMGKRIERVSVKTMQAFSQWHWPGNVRELQNAVERAVILSKGSVLNLPVCELKNTKRASQAPATIQTLTALERNIILRAVREANGNIASAAVKLGIKRTTLNSKMRRLKIKRSDLFAH
jgi:formate hydrogenlyase transcriptional activator